MRSFFRSRRPFKLTKGGWIFILYSIGVGAGAINTGNNLLYLVFGLFLGLILASGVLSDLTLWGLEATPIPMPDGRVGEPLLFALAVKNTKAWFPSLAVRVEARGLLNGRPVAASAFCAAIKPRSSVDSVLVFHPKERGRLIITNSVFITRFPFGLLLKFWSRKPTHPTEIIVLPKFLKNEPDLPFMADSAVLGDRSASRRGDGPTLFGIRDFQPADNPRRIHWKASAKRAGMWLVREMEDEEAETVRLLWPDPFPSISDGDLEVFISYAATIVETLRARRRQVVLMGGRPGSFWRLEEESIGRFLALFRPEMSPENARSVAATTGAVDLYSVFRSTWEKEGLE